MQRSPKLQSLRLNTIMDWPCHTLHTASTRLYLNDGRCQMEGQTRGLVRQFRWRREEGEYEKEQEKEGVNSNEGEVRRERMETAHT